MLGLVMTVHIPRTARNRLRCTTSHRSGAYESRDALALTEELSGRQYVAEIPRRRCRSRALDRRVALPQYASCAPCSNTAFLLPPPCCQACCQSAHSVSDEASHERITVKKHTLRTTDSHLETSVYCADIQPLFDPTRYVNSSTNMHDRAMDASSTRPHVENITGEQPAIPRAMVSTCRWVGEQHNSRGTPRHVGRRATVTIVSRRVCRGGEGSASDTGIISQMVSGEVFRLGRPGRTRE